MATAKVTILHGGKPLVGAKVIMGEVSKELITDANGSVSRTVPVDWGPVAVSVMVDKEDLHFGGGPFKIERDKELIIEV